MMIELMRASELIRGLPIEVSGDADFEVTGVSHDSRRVRPGDLFVALVGARADGREHIGEARERGASAVMGTGAAPSFYEGPWLEAEEPRALMARVSARVHDHPDRKLAMIGITGTNGKSTVAALVASMLEAAGRKAAIAGTLGHRFANVEIESALTTPEASDLYRFLAGVLEAGGEAVAMEVSSAALEGDRALGMTFDVAVFINLSRDHLDLHGSFESYFAAKRKLFDQLKGDGRAVVNLEDEYGLRLVQELRSTSCELVTFGEGGTVSIRSATTDLDGIRAVISTPRGDLDVVSKLRGRFNLENLLAAAACGEALKLDLGDIADGLNRRGPITGRLEPVDCGQSFPVFVDFAHTDAALSASLRSLREMAGKRKIVCVFGCGGEKDPGKRELMGKAAGELADLAILTSDNPRTEDPLAIIAAVEHGLRQSGSENYLVVPDRAEAIRRAIADADRESIVLVAGKGHEEGQIIGTTVHPFSDRQEIVRALEAQHG